MDTDKFIEVENLRQEVQLLKIENILLKQEIERLKKPLAEDTGSDILLAD